MSVATALTPLTLRRLAPADLTAYKALRDLGLRLHPDAFVSDFETEHLREPESYLGRLGLGEPLGGTFLLGAWRDGALVGCIGCERSTMLKTRHRADVYGLMVHPEHTGGGVGRRLVHQAVATGRQAHDLGMLTATITVSGDCVERLYQSAGFTRYGLLPHAVRVARATGPVYYDKAEMVLML